MSKIAAEQFISLSFGSLLNIHYCSHINHFYILLKVILCSSYFIPLQKSVMTQTSSFGGNGWYLSVIYIIWKIALMSFYSIFDKSGYNLHTVRCTDQKMGLTVFFSPRSSWSTVLSHCLKVLPTWALALVRAVLPLDLLCSGLCTTSACPQGVLVGPPLLHLNWDLVAPGPTVSFTAFSRAGCSPSHTFHLRTTSRVRTLSLPFTCLLSDSPSLRNPIALS